MPNKFWILAKIVVVIDFVIFMVSMGFIITKNPQAPSLTSTIILGLVALLLAYLINAR